MYIFTSYGFKLSFVIVAPAIKHLFHDLNILLSIIVTYLTKCIDICNNNFDIESIQDGYFLSKVTYKIILLYKNRYIEKRRNLYLNNNTISIYTLLFLVYMKDKVRKMVQMGHDVK